MTFLEAIEGVEQRLERMALTCLGEPLTGIEMTALVAKHHGARWDSTVDELQAGKITPGQYHERALEMIEEFDRAVFNRSIGRRLIALGRIQAEGA